MGMPAWIIAIQWISRFVLLLLSGLSVWSVSIMVDRYRLFKLREEEGTFEDARKLIRTKSWGDLASAIAKKTGLKAGLLQAALQTPSHGPEQIDRAVKSYLSSEKTSLEKGLTTLATLGSNAPFIGLFGTVLGIIQAFGSLANQQSSTAGVMSAISEALVATAIGLFVAIPAVVAYNVFNRKMRVLLSECESLRDLFIAFRGD